MTAAMAPDSAAKVSRTRSAGVGLPPRAVPPQRLGQAQVPGLEVRGVEVHEVPVHAAGQAGDPQRVDVALNDGPGDAEVLSGLRDGHAGVLRDPGG